MKSFVVLLMVVAAAAGWSQPRWALSNEEGTILASLPEGPTPTGWSLELSGAGESGDQTLFSNGIMNAKLHLRDGVLVWRERLDPVTQKVTEETLYDHGKPSQILTLSYDGTKLAQRTARNAQGTLLWTDLLWYNPQGSVRRLERTAGKNVIARTSWTSGADGSLTQTWSQNSDTMAPGERRVWTYSPTSTVEVLEDNDGIKWHKVTKWDSDGAKVVTITAGKKTTDDHYDLQGHLVSETVRSGETLLSERTWKYNKKGILIEDSSNLQQSQNRWTYVDNPDGTTTSILKRDDIIVREEVLKDGDRQKVRLYDRGKLFLEEIWSKGHKVKEIYYDDGKITRERTP